jgi:thymidine phosphorylase
VDRRSGCAAVSAGQPLYTVRAETLGELEYALDYVSANPDVVRIGDE